MWSKYRSEAAISSIEKLVCVDHCPGSSSENRPIAQAKVYGNWLVSSPAGHRHQQCISLGIGAAALREGFDATMKDPKFLADADQQRMTVTPMTGAEVEAAIKELYQTPADIVAAAKKISGD